MASSRGSTASSKPPKQRLAVTAQSATSKPWFTCSQPNSISCFQTEIVATHAKQRRTLFTDSVRASQTAPDFLDRARIIAHEKQNFATRIAALVIPGVGNNHRRHEEL